MWWRTILTNTTGPKFLVVDEDWLCFDYRQQTAIWSPRWGGGRVSRGAGNSRAAIGRNGRLFYTQTENIKHFEDACSQRVQCANAFREVSSNSSFKTKFGTRASTAFLADISWSVDSKWRSIISYVAVSRSKSESHAAYSCRDSLANIYILRPPSNCNCANSNEWMNLSHCCCEASWG
jgi:hypothetical protein